MDAAQVLDEMPPRKKSATKMDDLHDELLPIIVSFLPAHEAVRTCVLATRWRHVWTCSPTLRITAVKGFGSARFIHFIDQLLLLRRQGPCPLESCDFDLVETDLAFDWSMLVEHVYLHSIQTALDCHARTIICRFLPANPNADFRHDLPDPAAPLLSQHLQSLELRCSRVNLDFSGCPALRNLRMEHCLIFSESLVAPGLQYLSITSCHLYEHLRTTISLPNLVRLELVENFGRLPLLENLPSLTTATIRLGDYSGDRCYISDTGCHNDDPCWECRFAFEFDASRRSSYFFQGLSKATHLELSAKYEYAFILQRDLKWRPTFPVLKTLVLDDWCLDADLGALVLFLQRSPKLEKLTLKLDEEFDASMVTEGDTHPLAWASAAKLLKMVEIKCEIVDARVHKVLDVLTSGGISHEKIDIQQTGANL